MSTNPYVPVLFFSERCPNSVEIIKTIQGLNKASLFRFVSVDTTPRQFLPPDLKAVPTLYIPDTKQMIAGKTAIYGVLSKPVQARREVPQARPPATKPAEPMFWSFNDQPAMSVTYSSFDGASQTPDDQLRFSYLSGEIKTTGQDVLQGNESTRNHEDFSSRLEQMQSIREKEYVAAARQ